MSLPQLSDEYGSLFPLTAYAAENLKGNRLPGGTVTQYSGKKFAINHFSWETPSQLLHFRSILHADFKFAYVHESVPGIRFEALLKGELKIVTGTGKVTTLQQGQYHIAAAAKYKISLPKKSACDYVVVYLPAAMLREFDVDPEMLLSNAVALSSELSGVLREMLHNPFQGKLRAVYYQKLIADILFFHLAGQAGETKVDMTEADIEAVRRADAILSADLTMHYKIPELCALTGTNEYKLKRGFRILFNMGMFARLLQKRMDHAKFLLSTTNKPIKDIAYETGYDTHAGFITAFRKRFGKTPLEWRNDVR